ncbi:MAG: hypothetical protein CML68_14000 [Rhodobacteraceae bacterium]|nr:hypothetical protein [Paracoccaceae bacterium]
MNNTRDTMRDGTSDSSEVLPGLFALRRRIDKMCRAAATLAAIGVVFACAAISWAVFARGALGWNTVWEMEASVYTLIYAALLSAAYTDRAGGQIGVRVLADKLTGRAAEMHRLVMDILTLGLFLIFTWSAWDLFSHSWSTGWTTGTIWDPPLWLPHAAFPVGGALLVVAVTVDIAIRIRGGHIDPPKDAGGH